MRRSRDLTEIIFDIKRELPGFNIEELLEYTKWVIPNLYDDVRKNENQETNIRCNKELINKLISEKEKYRISKDIDHMNIQYEELFDYEKKDGELHIKVYLSIYFYDNTWNNEENQNESNKYWNDIWIVTCKTLEAEAKKHSNCVNCGAVMEYDDKKDVFECKYCGNTINNKSNKNWEIIDIELGHE